LKLKGSPPRLAADEDEPQEAKVSGLPNRAAFAVPPQSGQIPAAGSSPVKFEPELLEPRAHRVPEASRISFVFKANHDVIGVAHDDDIAEGFSPSPWHGPEVEDVVK